jgi:hypothetical protein
MKREDGPGQLIMSRDAPTQLIMRREAPLARPRTMTMATSKSERKHKHKHRHLHHNKKHAHKLHILEQRKLIELKVEMPHRAVPLHLPNLDHHSLTVDQLKNIISQHTAEKVDKMILYHDRRHLVGWKLLSDYHLRHGDLLRIERPLLGGSDRVYRPICQWKCLGCCHGCWTECDCCSPSPRTCAETCCPIPCFVQLDYCCQECRSDPSDPTIGGWGDGCDDLCWWATNCDCDCSCCKCSDSGGSCGCDCCNCGDSSCCNCSDSLGNCNCDCLNCGDCSACDCDCGNCGDCGDCGDCNC